MLARERVQQVGELGVAVEAVEGDGGHAGAGAKANRSQTGEMPGILAAFCWRG